MAPCLVLFIDGLPHYELSQTTTLKTFETVCALQPTFGFSPNIYAELFAGLTADEVGFFNEWNRDPDARRDPANRVFGALAPLLDATRVTGLSSTLTHRLLGKLIRRKIANIPFRYLPLYSHSAVKVYELPQRGLPTMFTRHDFRMVLGERHHTFGLGDELCFAETLETIPRGGNVYVSLLNYDNLCHAYGVAGPRTRARLGLLDHWVRLLTDTFLSVNPDGTVFVLSDHGMVDVTAGYDLRIEDEFGPADTDGYLYFPDSVMCRVWSADRSRLSAIRAWLAGLGVGSVVTDEERARWGITNPDFGDIVFVLDEGLCFQQNFHGWRLPMAMHGYHPKHYSQHAVFLAHNARGLTNNSVISSLEANRVIEAHAGSGA